MLLKDAELHVANAGDCRVVLSRSGTAIALTSDHRVVREDERLRIESKVSFAYQCPFSITYLVFLALYTVLSSTTTKGAFLIN